MNPTQHSSSQCLLLSLGKNTFGDRAFFDFIQVPEGGMVDRCKVFCETINTNTTAWLLANTLKFQY